MLKIYKIMQDKTDEDEISQYIIVFDYDGVITKRGTSGVNEEKWLERENNFFWRKLIYLISCIYNTYVPFDEIIIELMKKLKELNCKIVIVSSHALTTRNYPESEQIKNKIIDRLEKEHVPYDEIFFEAGDKVDICKKIGAHLVIEDTVSKIKALRENNILTIGKLNKKNSSKLLNNLDEVYDSSVIISNVLYIIKNYEFIKQSLNSINQNKKFKNHFKDFDDDFENDLTSEFTTREFYKTQETESVMTKKLVPSNKKY